MTPDDENYIGYTITDVGRLLRTVFERRVRAFGLTRAQWMVIARVHRRPGLSQSEVADLLEIEKAPAGRLIDRMQAKGWLERRDDRSDRRVNRLHLTPEGERLHAAIWPIAEATVDDALGDLSAKEQRQLTALMTRVKAKLLALAEHDRRAVAHKSRGSEGPNAMTSLLTHPALRPVLLIAVPVAVVLAALVFWLWGGRYISTENAYVKGDIAQVSAEVAGRVLEVHVRDHAEVKTGDLLVNIDPEPFRVALAQADAELDATRGQVRTLIATWHEALSEMQEAESKVAFWTAQLERQKTLSVRGIVASSKLEEVESSAIAAADRVVVMRKKVERVAAQLGNNPARPVDEHPLVREKRAQQERAKLELARTVIRAPLGGTTVNVRLQKGDQVKTASVLFAIVADTRPWVEANFKETELTHVAKGLTATVVLDMYPDVTWQAEVESISPATGAEFALLPPQNASGNWVKVVQRLPVRLRLVPMAGEPMLRAGMTASVRIDTKRQRSLASLFGGATALATSGP